MTTAEIIGASQDLMAIESTADNPSGLYDAYEYVRDFVHRERPDITIEEFESDGRPSLLAYEGARRPPRFDLILNGHLDVVPGAPEQFKPYIENGRLYGRGAYDMKVAAIALTALFCESPGKGRALQIVTSEETGGATGTGYQIEQGVRADLVICGECGRAEDKWEIATEAKGVAAIEFSFDGAAAHGAYPWLGDNAANKAVEFAGRVISHHPVPTDPTDKTTVTLARIDAGGTAHNQVPDAGTVSLDCRYMPGDPRFRDKETIAEHFRSIDPIARIKRYLSYGPPAYADPNHPLVQMLKSAAEQVEGHPFGFVRRNGASDGRFYTAVGGQAIEFGVAGRNHHADDESISLVALENYVRTMRAFLEGTLAAD